MCALDHKRSRMRSAVAGLGVLSTIRSRQGWHRVLMGVFFTRPAVRIILQLLIFAMVGFGARV